MTTEVKTWNVVFSHKDGRHGSVEVQTKVGQSQAFQYGNGKYGALIIGDFEQGYDLRYSSAKDLHKVMLDEYFGEGLVEAVSI